MTVISSVVVNPGGTPVHGATVTVSLVSSGSLPGFTDSETVTGVARLTTKQDGSWSLSLTPNALILPANTHYRVTEKVSPSLSVTYSIIVPETGGPYSVRDVLAVDPIGPSPLTPAGAVAWDDVTGKPVTFPPSTHGHAIADVTGLQTALDSAVGGPRPGEYPLEQGYGLVAATGDPLHFMQSSGFNGVAFFSRIWVPAGKAITGLWVAVRTAASGHDGFSNGNRIGLYTDAGVLVDQTPVDNTLWAVTGWRGGNLVAGPVAAQGTGRFVYVAAIANGYSSGASVSFATGSGDSISIQRGPTGVGNRRNFFNGGAALPANFDPTTFGTATGFIPLYGIS